MALFQVCGVACRIDAACSSVGSAHVVAGRHWFGISRHAAARDIRHTAEPRSSCASAVAHLAPVAVQSEDRCARDYSVAATVQRGRISRRLQKLSPGQVTSKSVDGGLSRGRGGVGLAHALLPRPLRGRVGKWTLHGPRESLAALRFFDSPASATPLHAPDAD